MVCKEAYGVSNENSEFPGVLEGQGPGGGYSRQFRMGVCRQDSQTLTLFKGRKSRIDSLLKDQNQEMDSVTRW